MFDFFKEYKYYAGIKFESTNQEFFTEKTAHAFEAFEVARGALKDKPYEVNFYIQSGKDYRKIPFSELQSMEGLAHSELERRIKIMSKELFSKRHK